MNFRAVPLAVLALTVAGCSNADHSGEAPPAIQIQPVRSDTQVTGPAQQELLTRADQQLLLRGYDVAMAACAAKAGTVFSVQGDARPKWIREVTSALFTSQPLGPVDASRVAQFGFHDPKVLISDLTVAFESPATSSDVISRCDPEAREALGGTPPAGVPASVLDADTRAANDKRMDGPTKAWRDCMARAGYKYKTPIAAAMAFRPAHSLTTAELDAAQASVSCQQASHVIDTQVALIAAYEGRLLQQQSERFADFRAWKQTALARSAVLVAKHPLPADRTEIPPITLGFSAAAK